ncbi:MAG: hypothetical protein ABI056_02105 [Caulobacteraceae bacterium]
MADPTAGAASQSAGGLPQFDASQWPGQMVWVLVVFAILYVLFARVFVPRLGGAIDAREAKIAADIAEARRLKGEAEAQATAAAEERRAARDEAQRLAARAKSEAKTMAARRRAEEAGRLAVGFADAEARIGAARDRAMEHVHSIALETAGAIIVRLTGAPASDEEIETALAPVAVGGHA